MPSITVVTICFNNKEELIKSCASVNTQEEHPFEHIIIDGSTTTDIKDYLESNTQPSWRRWICERDNGIADAFNKGVQNANGDIIHLLNSGDIYFDDTVLKKVAAHFTPGNGSTWCHGKLHMKRGGSWVIIGKPFHKTKLYRGMRGTLHPTMFVSKEVYKKHGVFDTSLKIAMDYDFLLRIADEPFTYLDFPIVTFDPHGVSSNAYLASLKENKSCYQKYYGNSFKLNIWQWRLKFLHFVLHSPIGNFLYRIKKGLGMENV
jgi:glycosyltransferase involved in cell wall biosynthesis